LSIGEVALTLEGRLFVRLGPAPEIQLGVRGSYALVLRLDDPAELIVGRLGTCSFPPGRYVYCGSALGGLRARVARHLRAEKRPHWHVDYLLAVARVVDVWICEAAERLECQLAAHLASQPGASVQVPGFGSSDCRCRSHLIYEGREPAS
jgi:Uri superfamily endonuclease